MTLRILYRSSSQAYLRGHISRFGAYATDELGRHPEAFNPVLNEVDFTILGLAA